MRAPRIASVLLILAASNLAAQPDPSQDPPLEGHRIGRPEAGCLSIPTFSADEPSTRWSNSVRRSGVLFWILNVTVHNRGLGHWQLRVVNPGNRVIGELDSDSVTAVPFEWPSPEAQNGVTVQLLGDLRDLDIDVDQCIVGEPEAQLKSVIPPDNRKDIGLFRKEPLYAWGRSVARLKVLDDLGYYTCTAFLVAPDLLLTNDHCVTAKWKKMTAEFNFEKGNLGQIDAVAVTRVTKPDPALGLDVVVLTLERGTPYPVGKLATTTVGVGEPLTLIQHPAGEEKQVARGNDCRSSPGATSSTDFAHICDTLKGSSGSPVFDDQGIVVGLHRKGFKEGRPGGRNQAIFAFEIRLKFLEKEFPAIFAAAPPNTPQPAMAADLKRK